MQVLLTSPPLIIEIVMFKEEIKLKGYLVIRINDNIVMEVPNIVVNTGKNYTASRISGNSPTPMSHMAIGTGTSTPLVGDTTLESELSRVAFSSSDVSDNTIIFRASYGPGVGTGAINEAGIFNAGSGGIMLCRTTFQTSNKDSTDEMSIVWTIQVG